MGWPMSGSKPLDIERLFEGSLLRLRAEAEYFSQLTDHDPELGRLNETHLVNLLRAYLPPKIGIGTGFIACGGNTPKQSPQCDIVLFDALNNAPLYNSQAWSIYPIEMVYAIIEVTTTLKRAKLKNAFEKCAELRAMAGDLDGNPNKAYLTRPPQQTDPSAILLRYREKLPPRFFVFSYGGWKMMKTLKKNFIELSEEHVDAHIHGLCSLSEHGSLFIRHNAFKTGEDRYLNIAPNGFRFFLMNLPAILDTMLPSHRMGLGFDQIDLGHYDLAVK